MQTRTNFIRAIELFIAYLLVHKAASLKTAEQYELHIWKFLEYLQPDLAVFANMESN